MDSGKINNKFDINSVSQDDINRFEDFLREAEFLAAPAGEPVKRFLELTFGRRLQTFLTKVSSAKLEPIVVRAYFEQHKDDIANIFKNETKFVLELLQLHLMDLVMFLNNDKIVKPMLNEQRKQVQNTNDIPHADAEQVQNVVNSVRNSCQMYGNSLNDMVMYSTGIDQRQIVFAELFRQVLTGFKNMILQVAERDMTITRRDETIAEKDKIIIQKDATIAEKDKIIAQKDATIAETNVDSLNKQLKDEKERADKLQEENKQLLENKTDAAVATKEVEGLRAQLVDKTQLVSAKDQLITVIDGEIKKQKEELEEQKKNLEKERAQVEKLKQEVEKQKKENEEKQAEIEKQKKENEEQSKILKIQQQAIRVANGKFAEMIADNFKHKK